MVYEQENLIIADIGSFAAVQGKTIDSILVGYANNEQLKEDGGGYEADLDYITIEDVSPQYKTLAD